MRKPIIAGNWKMNKTPDEAKALVTELKPLVKDANCDVVVCVPAVNFAAVKEVAKGSKIKLGAEITITSSVPPISCSDLHQLLLGHQFCTLVIVLEE